ncbi:hypothetical protein V1478_004631 [Vespula squamosa]|uniref:Uncharacterized protein n=1 Tax=Vespula squamosa TaxID=30214 RepID=A0ABD2BHN2_VESSQ
MVTHSRQVYHRIFRRISQVDADSYENIDRRNMQILFVYTIRIYFVLLGVIKVATRLNFNLEVVYSGRIDQVDQTKSTSRIVSNL